MLATSVALAMSVPCCEALKLGTWKASWFIRSGAPDSSSASAVTICTGAGLSSTRIPVRRVPVTMISSSVNSSSSGSAAYGTGLPIAAATAIATSERFFRREQGLRNI